MQLVRLSRRLEARGHSLATIVKQGSPAIAELHAANLSFDQLGIGGKANLLAIRRLREAARRFEPDLLHSHLSSASWWCGWLEQLGGPPSIGHVHGFTSGAWHRNQSHLLAVSNAVKDDLVRQRIDPQRITVLCNALAEEEFHPTRTVAAVRAEMLADANTQVVGTFAHLSEKKGHRELFEAMPVVLRELPHTQFWIVGQGNLSSELEATARRHGVLANVRFLGYRRDVADLMHAIDVMALPSHREPFGLVYVEAALARKPIVACRAGGAPESIADGETGLLVPVRDSAAIAQALITLLTNRGRAVQMGQAGYERAHELFSWERYLSTLEAVYEQVLNSVAVGRRSPKRPAA
jgi:glycosyltransferase involved in cell wall biosynthesis